MKHFILSLGMMFAAMSIFAAGNEIVVSDVVLSQNNSSRIVTVSYTLSGEPAIVTVDFLTNGVSIGEANFSNVSGDVNKLVTKTDSQCTIQWKPYQSWPDHIVNGMTAKVTAWLPEEPPDYLVVPLLEKSSTVAYYVSTNALPEGGLANDIYRTTHLVMRRIHASGVRWQMGATAADYEQAKKTAVNPSAYETAHYVTLSKDYYMGIYPVTQEQYRRFTQSASLSGDFTGYADSYMRPRNGISYNNVRGKSTTTDHSSVGGSSAIGKLRSYTGIDFDLPSDAEWEYACKAGTTLLLYTGKAYSEANVYEIAWVYGNSLYSDVNARQTHVVGQKLPNAWGLYDMIGNTLEWCRDFYVKNLGTDEVVDPVMKSGEHRVVRGFRYNISSNKSYATTTFRGGENPGIINGDDGFGFRVMCPITLKFD